MFEGLAALSGLTLAAPAAAQDLRHMCQIIMIGDQIRVHDLIAEKAWAGWLPVVGQD